MHGNIESIGVVSHRSLATQLLLLSFTHAKASTVRYNPATHSLDLFSMHYFEKEELKVSDMIDLSCSRSTIEY